MLLVDLCGSCESHDDPASRDSSRSTSAGNFRSALLLSLLALAVLADTRLAFDAIFTGWCITPMLVLLNPPPECYLEHIPKVDGIDHVGALNSPDVVLMQNARDNFLRRLRWARCRPRRFSGRRLSLHRRLWSAVVQGTSLAAALAGPPWP